MAQTPKIDPAVLRRMEKIRLKYPHMSAAEALAKAREELRKR